MRILFLTAQLQPFLCACLKELVTTTDAKVLLYTQESDPYGLVSTLDARIRVDTYVTQPRPDFWGRIDGFQPEIVFCAGWMYRQYLRWCRVLQSRGAQSICAMDTQWKASLRQYALIALSQSVLHSAFSYAWVPGPRQKDYARRLGFDTGCILEGLYAADIRLFGAVAKRSANFQTQAPFPKRFLFVGRFVKHKLLPLLLAFHRLSAGDLNGWKLELIGSGPLLDDPLLHHPCITVRNSLSQDALAEEAAKGGVFCLCSADEPWGTVIQEFCAAGMPLVVSKQCGAADLFVRNNGMLCDGTDPEDIARVLECVMTLPEEQLFAMAQESARLGLQPDVVTWVNTLRTLEKR